MAGRFLTPFMRDPLVRSTLKDVKKLYRDMDRAFMMPQYWADKTLTETHKFAQQCAEVVNDDKEFKVKVDVSHFTPEELKVSVKDKYLQIEGNHEERSDDYGTIQRKFIRRYALPPDLNGENVKSELNEEGILTVGGMKNFIEGKDVKKIPIEFK
uniref:Protein lethal(2)essential for life (inferred by orthology to a D. melanogaster protein) n=1 Tax=Strongyloides venezuelensis TaxID=75913 RepID=A0A0K0FD72_STRVS